MSETLLGPSRAEGVAFPLCFCRLLWQQCYHMLAVIHTRYCCKSRSMCPRPTVSFRFVSLSSRPSRPQATDAFAGPLEKARCLSLLADLAVDPRCARTLFQGGVVPQMLLNAQGCTHVELIDVHGGGGGTSGSASGSAGGLGGGSDGRASPALSGTSCDSEVRSRTATEDLDAEQQQQEEEEEERQHEVVVLAAPASPTGGGGAPSEVACCRCRQAMRLLARLVRGLPGETPAVVVRHSGLRSIVQILEDGAAEAAALAAAPADGGDGYGRLPTATEAAVREALEVRGTQRVCSI